MCIRRAILAIALSKLARSSSAPAGLSRSGSPLIANPTAPPCGIALDGDGHKLWNEQLDEWLLRAGDDDDWNTGPLSPLIGIGWDIHDPFGLGPIGGDSVVIPNIQTTPLPDSTGADAPDGDGHPSAERRLRRPTNRALKPTVTTAGAVRAVNTTTAQSITTGDSAVVESDAGDNSGDTNAGSRGLSVACRAAILNSLSANPDTPLRQLYAIGEKLGATSKQVRDFVHHERRFICMVPAIHELMVTDEMVNESANTIVLKLNELARNGKVPELPKWLMRRVAVWKTYCIEPTVAGMDDACTLEADGESFRLSLEQQSAFFSDSVGWRKWRGRPAFQDLLRVSSPSAMTGRRSANQLARTSRKRQSDREREAITPTAVVVAAQRRSANRRSVGALRAVSAADGVAGEAGPGDDVPADGSANDRPYSLRKRTRIVRYEDPSDDYDDIDEEQEYDNVSSQSVSGGDGIGHTAPISASMGAPEAAPAAQNSSISHPNKVSSRNGKRAPKVPRGFIRVGPAGLGQKSFGLSLLIDNPKLDFPTFYDMIKTRYPSANRVAVRGFRDRLIARLHTTALVHSELLAMGLSDPDATVQDLKAAIIRKCVAKSEKVPTHLYEDIVRWRKYCIVPHLNGHSPAPCHPHFLGTSSQAAGMHLSTEMSRALFRDLYALWSRGKVEPGE